jgi:hypothetical protein
VTPRLLTDRAAAEYLSMPIASVRRMQEGRVEINGRVRWDRVKLDEMLDGDRPAVAKSRPSNDDDPEAALDRFLEDQGHASGGA